MISKSDIIIAGQIAPANDTLYSCKQNVDEEHQKIFKILSPQHQTLSSIDNVVTAAQDFFNDSSISEDNIHKSLMKNFTVAIIAVNSLTIYDKDQMVEASIISPQIGLYST